MNVFFLVNRVATSNGIAAAEQGKLVEPSSADQSPSYQVQGQFSWVAPDGQSYSGKSHFH